MCMWVCVDGCVCGGGLWRRRKEEEGQNWTGNVVWMETERDPTEMVEDVMRRRRGIQSLDPL